MPPEWGRRWWYSPQISVVVLVLALVSSLLNSSGEHRQVLGIPWKESLQQQEWPDVSRQTVRAPESSGRVTQTDETILFLNKPRVSLSVFFPGSAISGAFLSRRAFFWLTRIPHVLI